jgi:hypothetical protein
LGIFRLLTRSLNKAGKYLIVKEQRQGQKCFCLFDCINQNIPELENRIQKALLISHDPKIMPEEFKKNLSLTTIERFSPNLTKVAERDGKSPPYLYEMLDKFGLRVKKHLD